MQNRRWVCAAALCVAALVGLPASAQTKPFRVGLIVPMTGPFTSVGRQIDAGVRLYMAQHGDTVAGRKIEVILKDDGAVPANTRRIAQELIVGDKVDALAGFAITPSALAVAPLATQSKTPLIVMSAAASAITEASPYVVRSSFTVGQVSVPLADYVTKNGMRKVVTLVTDYAPGVDAEQFFAARFKADGGQVLDTLRVPLKSPDYAPFMQKVRDLHPDGLFIFVPAPEAPAVVKQFRERGLDRAGVQLIGTGDVVDDDSLDRIGDEALGILTAHHYSAAHASPANDAFVQAYQKANSGQRPNFMAVGGYDGMQLLYAALAKTGGTGGGDALVAAMKGLQVDSPRGPWSVDPATRDIVQNVYIRKVDKVRGQLFNVEILTIPAVADPGKAK
ncbi:ABC transporter substrate-binding protein [Ramlibacter ginsenosidimutans]|uniref:ABC transporter substrate-binding protein n=1 Tax=Ramlibacter ginsenosidimutans TaxID=502333 RepID=A0A934WN81_9BURK|nr:ABC transporter substrate-binding protein [Ramlibacter ginsenosidimutans]MBK6007278.1 ABC transporter substrate-binding protein [Ramlibacter ginsenosidimutans]